MITKQELPYSIDHFGTNNKESLKATKDGTNNGTAILKGIVVKIRGSIMDVACVIAKGQTTSLEVNVPLPNTSAIRLYDWIELKKSSEDSSKYIFDKLIPEANYPLVTKIDNKRVLLTTELRFSPSKADSKITYAYSPMFGELGVGAKIDGVDHNILYEGLITRTPSKYLSVFGYKWILTKQFKPKVFPSRDVVVAAEVEEIRTQGDGSEGSLGSLNSIDEYMSCKDESRNTSNGYESFDNSSDELSSTLPTTDIDSSQETEVRRLSSSQLCGYEEALSRCTTNTNLEEVEVLGLITSLGGQLLLATVDGFVTELVQKGNVDMNERISIGDWVSIRTNKNWYFNRFGNFDIVRRIEAKLETVVKNQSAFVFIPIKQIEKMIEEFHGEKVELLLGRTDIFGSVFDTDNNKLYNVGNEQVGAWCTLEYSWPKEVYYWKVVQVRALESQERIKVESEKRRVRFNEHDQIFNLNDGNVTIDRRNVYANQELGIDFPECPPGFTPKKRSSDSYSAKKKVFCADEIGYSFDGDPQKMKFLESVTRIISNPDVRRAMYEYSSEDFYNVTKRLCRGWMTNS